MKFRVKKLVWIVFHYAAIVSQAALSLKKCDRKESRLMRSLEEPLKTTIFKSQEEIQDKFLNIEKCSNTEEHNDNAINKQFKTNNLNDNIIYDNRDIRHKRDTIKLNTCEQNNIVHIHNVNNGTSDIKSNFSDHNVNDKVIFHPNVNTYEYKIPKGIEKLADTQNIPISINKGNECINKPTKSLEFSLPNTESNNNIDLHIDKDVFGNNTDSDLFKNNIKDNVTVSHNIKAEERTDPHIEIEIPLEKIIPGVELQTSQIENKILDNDTIISSYSKIEGEQKSVLNDDICMHRSPLHQYDTEKESSYKPKINSYEEEEVNLPTVNLRSHHDNNIETTKNVSENFNLTYADDIVNTVKKKLLGTEEYIFNIHGNNSENNRNLFERIIPITGKNMETPDYFINIDDYPKVESNSEVIPTMGLIENPILNLMDIPDFRLENVNDTLKNVINHFTTTIDESSPITLTSKAFDCNSGTNFSNSKRIDTFNSTNENKPSLAYVKLNETQLDVNIDKTKVSKSSIRKGHIPKKKHYESHINPNYVVKDNDFYMGHHNIQNENSENTVTNSFEVACSNDDTNNQNFINKAEIYSNIENKHGRICKPVQSSEVTTFSNDDYSADILPHFVTNNNVMPSLNNNKLNNQYANNFIGKHFLKPRIKSKQNEKDINKFNINFPNDSAASIIPNYCDKLQNSAVVFPTSKAFIQEPRASFYSNAIKKLSALLTPNVIDRSPDLMTASNIPTNMFNSSPNSLLSSETLNSGLASLKTQNLKATSRKPSFPSSGSVATKTNFPSPLYPCSTTNNISSVSEPFISITKSNDINTDVCPANAVFFSPNPCKFEVSSAKSLPLLNPIQIPKSIGAYKIKPMIAMPKTALVTLISQPPIANTSLLSKINKKSNYDIYSSTKSLKDVIFPINTDSSPISTHDGYYFTPNIFSARLNTTPSLTPILWPKATKANPLGSTTIHISKSLDTPSNMYPYQTIVPTIKNEATSTPNFWEKPIPTQKSATASVENYFDPNVILTSINPVQSTVYPYMEKVNSVYPCAKIASNTDDSDSLASDFRYSDIIKPLTSNNHYLKSNHSKVYSSIIPNSGRNASTRVPISIFNRMSQPINIFPRLTKTPSSANIASSKKKPISGNLRRDKLSAEGYSSSIPMLDNTFHKKSNVTNTVPIVSYPKITPVNELNDNYPLISPGFIKVYSKTKKIPTTTSAIKTPADVCPTPIHSGIPPCNKYFPDKVCPFQKQSENFFSCNNPKSVTNETKIIATATPVVVSIPKFSPVPGNYRSLSKPKWTATLSRTSSKDSYSNYQLLSSKISPCTLPSNTIPFHFNSYKAPFLNPYKKYLPFQTKPTSLNTFQIVPSTMSSKFEPFGTKVKLLDSVTQKTTQTPFSKLNLSPQTNNTEVPPNTKVFSRRRNTSKVVQPDSHINVFKTASSLPISPAPLTNSRRLNHKKPFNYLDTDEISSLSSAFSGYVPLLSLPIPLPNDLSSSLTPVKSNFDSFSSKSFSAFVPSLTDIKSSSSPNYPDDNYQYITKIIPSSYIRPPESYKTSPIQTQATLPNPFNTAIPLSSLCELTSSPCSYYNPYKCMPMFSKPISTNFKLPLNEPTFERTSAAVCSNKSPSHSNIFPSNLTTVTNSTNTPKKLVAIVAKSMNTAKKSATIVPTSLNSPKHLSIVTPTSRNIPKHLATIVPTSLNTSTSLKTPKNKAAIVPTSLNRPKYLAAIVPTLMNTPKHSATIVPTLLNTPKKLSTTVSTLLKNPENITAIAPTSLNSSKHLATVVPTLMNMPKNIATIVPTSLKTAKNSPNKLSMTLNTPKPDIATTSSTLSVLISKPVSSLPFDPILSFIPLIYHTNTTIPISIPTAPKSFDVPNSISSPQMPYTLQNTSSTLPKNIAMTRLHSYNNYHPIHHSNNTKSLTSHQPLSSQTKRSLTISTPKLNSFSNILSRNSKTPFLGPITPNILNKISLTSPSAMVSTKNPGFFNTTKCNSLDSKQSPHIDTKINIIYPTKEIESLTNGKSNRYNPLLKNVDTTPHKDSKILQNHTSNHQHLYNLPKDVNKNTPKSAKRIKLGNLNLNINNIGNVDFIKQTVKEKELNTEKPSLDLKDFKFKTNHSGIDLKAWQSKITIIKPKLVLKSTDYNIINFLPVVTDNNFDPNIVQNLARDFIESNYGKPLVLKGVNGKLIEMTDDMIKLLGDKRMILWPTYCDFK